VLAVLRKHEVETVVLAGFMRLLTGHFLDAFPERVVNIHPALLPAFPGMDAQKQAFDYGVKVTGVTVHLVDRGTDTGPVLAQRVVLIHDGDTLDELRERILAEEHRLYPEVLARMARGGYLRDGRRTRPR
jgi:phosphoribosylglycinamide formyltransferase-1